ncbi:MAG: CBS domain-containing protein [Acidimicrobiia bacterium]|nr:CBS domain-containing protein [Acidimicrobiia bacterium]MDH3470164.1 CBS domain-containing protein [Acidimicrobiia bacterium]
MKTVAHILETKGSEVWSVRPSDSVFQALELMADKGLGAVLVMEGDELMGIMSERDYARKVILNDLTSKGTPVSEIMTSRVVVVPVEHTVEDCMAVMTDKHIRHLPVMDGDSVVGVVSIGDVVKAVISEREFMIEQLERYIQSSG